MSSPSASTDRTGQARIRDAALDLFAEHGYDKTTIRAIAERAGVSAPLVIHHFGSKEGLRRACDDYLLTWFSSEKRHALAGGDLPSRAQYFAEHPELGRLYGYLRRACLAGGEIADELFDRLVADVADFLDVGERSGIVREHADPEARAVVAAAFGLGVLLLDRQIGRHLGGESLMDEVVLDRYTRFVLDFSTHGLLARPITFAPDGADKEH